MKRREFIKLMSIGGFTLANLELSKEKKKPNIIFILTDDLGYGDLSCYGGTDLETPNIDNIASSGIKFENFYANCPVCSPTRASVLTGMFPDLVGVPGVIRTHITNSFGYLSSIAVLLPKVLKSAGYDTALIGKWHLGLESPNTPNEHGFDHFHGFLGDMMDDYYTHLRHNINYMRLNMEKIDPEGHATELFTEWSIDYIKQKARSDKPFFLYLGYNAPHTPIQPPDEWLKCVKDRNPNIDDRRAKIIALIEHLDDGVGRVVKAVDDAGLSEDTLIMFVSDNGGDLPAGASNKPLHGGKGQMFEGGIKVPACATWKNYIKSNSINERVLLTMDIFPTFCEIAGAKFDHEINGLSFLDSLSGENNEKYDDRFLFWVRREGGLHYGGQAFYASRYKNWKLLQNTPFEPLRLYDLESDPNEQNPLDERHEKFHLLLNELQNHIIRSGAVAWQKYPVKI
ncbi:TPA: N-acetylgalactosamine 6-sulfate sulfatase [bacterium]|nr:N-acetylgalactosamine 6-sulfate sulfatase [bacterium]